MKNSEITGLSKEELVAKIAEEKENLSKLKFAHTISDIARLNNELTKVKNTESATETK